MNDGSISHEQRAMKRDHAREFKRYLLLEKGLSANTIDAYMADLGKLIAFTQDKGITLEEVEAPHLEEFLAELHDQGISPDPQPG